MSKIEKAKNHNGETIFPVTVADAVLMGNGQTLKGKLSELGSNVGLYNVTHNVPLASGYYTSVEARLAVPERIRKKGLVITYQVKEDKWVIEQFTQEYDTGYKWAYIEDSWVQYAMLEEVDKLYYALYGYTSLLKGEVVKYNIEPNKPARITVKNNTSDKTFYVYIALMANNTEVGGYIYDFWDGVSQPNFVRKILPNESVSIDYLIPDSCIGVKLNDNNAPAWQNGEMSMTIEGLIDISAKDISDNSDRISKNSDDIKTNTESLERTSKEILSINDRLDIIIPPDAVGDKTSIVKRGNLSEECNLGIATSRIKNVSDEYLNVVKIGKIAVSNTEYAVTGRFDYGFFIENTEVGNIIKEGKDKFTRFESYVYCKEGKFVDRSFLFYSGRGISAGITAMPSEQKSNEVRKYIVIFDNSILQDGDYLYISAYIDNLSQYTELTDFGMTGFKAALFDTLEDAKNGSIKADWIDINQASISVEDVRKEIELDKYGEGGTTYNNVKANKEYLSLVLGMIKDKVVNKQNRLLVSFNGDSIMGSQLSDVDMSDGYDTGNFPPNMSRMIVARKFYDKYKFSGEDTQFRNLLHTDWVKTNFSVDNGRGKDGFNRIEVFGANEGGTASITVSGYKYFKLVWSNFSWFDSSFKVLVSVNGGSFDKPSVLGINLSDAITPIDNDLRMTAYEICELNKSNSYTFKIVAGKNPERICFWGCEYWNNPRLDVVVEAYSGSIAKQNREKLIKGYYSDTHKPMLIISDVLCINDSSYVYNADYTIEGWMNDNAFIYNYCKENGVPMLLIVPHQAASIVLVEHARGLAACNNMHFIDIREKQKKNPPSSPIVNLTDGLHLSNYGQTYYFEEIEKIFK